MKHKMTARLVLYFASVLAVFSVVIGMFFATMFSQSTAQVYIDDLKKRAVAIAQTLSGMVDEDGSMGHGQGQGKGQCQGKGQGQGRGMGVYLRFLNDIAMSDVWIVDEKGASIEMSGAQETETSATLPEGVDEMIPQIFQGNISVIDESKKGIDSDDIIVGAPIYGNQGVAAAAVILRTHAEGIAEANAAGLDMLLLSLFAALAAGVVLAILLSRRFVRPLATMEQTTALLAQGEYGAKTGIRANDEIGSLARNIDILADKLEEAAKESTRTEQLRRDFISNVSHELRTPVTVIRGSLEALYEGVVADEAKVKEYYAQMIGESIHLERMVNDLLELSRLQNPGYAIIKERLNLPEVVEDAVRSARRIAAEKNITINEDKKVDVFEYEGDYARIKQMLMIILSNAIKFSPEGANVLIKTYMLDNALAISIADNGPGIPKEALSRIYERFYSLDKNAEGGTGLGLAIAKEIAERHGVKIEIESEAGKGTEFLLIFEV